MTTTPRFVITFVGDASPAVGEIRKAQTAMAVLREAADGPVYFEAILGARAMRERAFGPHQIVADGRYGTGAFGNERLVGIPEGRRR